MDGLTRRRVLMVCGAATVGIAGCNSIGSSEDDGNDDEIKDTDGDGVIDSEDYAPRDPDVQRKEQITDDSTSTEDTTEESTEDTAEESTEDTAEESQTFEPFTITIDTSATYLHVDTDDEDIPDPTPISLADEGISAGSEIIIEPLGKWSTSSFNNRTSCQTIGVFSETSELLDPGERYRVPGAVDAGPNHETRRTYDADEPTDIPEDFLISGSKDYSGECEQAQITVTVPESVEYLFISAEDNAYKDNVDDLDFEIRPA